MNVMVRLSSAEMSTRSPKPVCRRAVSALTAPRAPYVPTDHSASAPPTARGRPSALPWLCREPDSAWTRNSDDCSEARGPVSPKADRLTTTSSGWALWRANGSTAGRGRRAMSTEGRDDDHISGGGERIHRRSEPGAPGSRTTLSCDAARNRKRAPSLSPSLPTSPVTDQWRRLWPSGCSTRRTEAPASLRSLAQYAPATSSDRSRTRKPLEAGKRAAGHGALGDASSAVAVVRAHS